MEYVRFGSTGLKVSQLCLGTMTFGIQVDEARSRAILDAAGEAGITFIDTADAYPMGASAGDERQGRTEEIVGRWLKGRRDDFILASKGNAPMGTRPWDRGNSRKHLLEACENSLRRLGTDYLDLYQLHGPDFETPLEETLGALNDLVTAGKVRYIGVSNWPAWLLARSLGVSELHGWARFASVQPRYSLLYRQIEHELLPMCTAEGLAVIPYNPLAGGMLSGKHRADQPAAEGTRFGLDLPGDYYNERYWKDTEFAGVEALRPLAEAAGMSMVTMAIAWALTNPAVTAPIVGASRPEQLADAVQATEVVLDSDVLESLNAATRHFRLTEPVVWG
ncbi:MAG: aldo/keto reductase [Acidimicrobiales bacterium]|nr:aldo/keto reductase [Acidimicrobiales bacterium]